MVEKKKKEKSVHVAVCLVAQPSHHYLQPHEL